MDPRATPFVVAVTATFRRPAELGGLLRSLAQAPRHLGGMVIVDNAADEATRALAAGVGFPIEYHAPGENLGCGGGLHAGERMALERFPQLTHLWILDDDCVVFPETLDALLEAMTAAGADAAHPLTENADGELAWFPGLLDRGKFRIVRERQTPAEFIARCGEAPIPFSWSQGIALLVTRRAIEELGPHRTDYWVRGEDLEFTLRITNRWLGIYVPRARVRHLPPAQSNDPAVEYPKHVVMLQNLAYTGFRLCHGRRLLRTLPGNCLRFFRTWGFGFRTLADSAKAVLQGALLGQPAGRTRRESLR